eukprot:TRINITY_DN2601_c0_g1_i1.p1 TRINITY_DN2601_c0_g1~~TRINITY_DN2601_c0_g1_i1.p1  ORF type:complete len:611 (-),score=1.29 TRINITY_DN2601_c0_g1_i1:349-1962(-)
MRWNSTCLISKIHSRHSTLHKVLVIQNLLIYDGKVYFIVKHRTDQTVQDKTRYKLELFVNNELDFEVVNVSMSPLVFGKASVENLYEIKEVQEFNYALVMHSPSLKIKTLYQINNQTIPYAPSGEIYSLLCRLFNQCTIDDRVRNETLLISTLLSQRQLDWDNGINLNCFSRYGQFSVGLSSAYNQTLFLLRRAVLYAPLERINPPSLPNEVQNQCVKDGFAYDSSNQIQTSKPYDVSICAIFRNEGRFIVEWIAYHVIVGIQHFYLYNDDSTDDSLEVLKPFIQQNLVTVLNTKEIRSDHYFGMQGQMLKHCGDNFGKTTRWILATDLDEYLVIKGQKYNNNIRTWIQEHREVLQDTGSVQIPSQVFAGNYYSLNYSQLLIGELVHSYFASANGWVFKALVNTNGMLRPNVHFGYSYLPLRNGKLEDTCKIRDIHTSDCRGVDSIFIFHYRVRSFESCAQKANPAIFRKTYRTRSGLKFCNDMIFGHQYDSDYWQEERYLANEHMIKQVCKKMRELNEQWYTSKNACAKYESIVQG